MTMLLAFCGGLLVGILVGGWAYFCKGYAKGYNDRKIKEYTDFFNERRK